MTIYINAWLDCRKPYITLTNKKTGETLAHFSSQEIEKMFADGDVTLDELQSSKSSTKQSLIRTLFLFKMTREYEEQLHKLSSTVIHSTVNRKRHFNRTCQLDIKDVVPTTTSMFHLPHTKKQITH